MYNVIIRTYPHPPLCLRFSAYNNMEIPRLGKKVNQDIVDASIRLSFQRLGYEKPTEEQRQAIMEFVSGQDVLLYYKLVAGKACAVLSCLSFLTASHTTRRLDL